MGLFMPPAAAAAAAAAAMGLFVMAAVGVPGMLMPLPPFMCAIMPRCAKYMSICIWFMPAVGCSMPPAAASIMPCIMPVKLGSPPMPAMRAAAWLIAAAAAAPLLEPGWLPGREPGPRPRPACICCCWRAACRLLAAMGPWSGAWPGKGLLNASSPATPGRCSPGWLTAGVSEDDMRSLEGPWRDMGMPAMPGKAMAASCAAQDINRGARCVGERGCEGLLYTQVLPSCCCGASAGAHRRLAQMLLLLLCCWSCCSGGTADLFRVAVEAWAPGCDGRAVAGIVAQLLC